jgi:hypothetical protein
MVYEDNYLYHHTERKTIYTRKEMGLPGVYYRNSNSINICKDNFMSEYFTWGPILENNGMLLSIEKKAYL